MSRPCAMRASARPAFGRPNFRTCATLRRRPLPPPHLAAGGLARALGPSRDGRRVSRVDDSGRRACRRPARGWLDDAQLDLTEALAGKPEFTLGVDAVLPDERGLGEATLGETLAAKQDWYGLQGGIWKPAWLEARPALHIAELSVQTSCDLPAGRVQARGRLSHAEPGSAVAADACAATAPMSRSPSSPWTAPRSIVSSPARDVAAWSPDSPALYRVRMRASAQTAHASMR